jgi:hypothetical protein
MRVHALEETQSEPCSRTDYSVGVAFITEGCQTAPPEPP